VVGLSIKADVIDWDEYHSGERKEGAYLAVWTFIEKTASGISIILLGFAMQLVGYDPNVEQTEAMEWTLRGMYGVFPALCFLGGTVLLSRFTLNEEEHTEIRAELDRRRKEEAQ
jgi:GPH family glycoside/pentoside/hexuronide:cation symporter